VPLAVGAFAPFGSFVLWVGGATLVALGALGALGAQAGGAPKARATLRVIIWGVVAMAATSAIGGLVGAAL